MLNRRNHTFEQLGRTLRVHSADVVDAALPLDMLVLVLRMASEEARNDLLRLHHSSIVSRPPAKAEMR